MKHFITLIIAIFLFSCSNPYDRNLGLPLDFLYSQAIDGLNNDDLATAKKYFERIVDEYPYKEEGIEAQIFLIWISYFNNDYLDAEIAIDSFLQYYVYNDYIPWVKYMKAVVEYDQIPKKSRDLTHAGNALEGFFNIVKDNKSSAYAKDAKLKIEVIKYKLAQRSIDIAWYYLKNKNYISALNRYNEVVQYYSDTIFVQEAMYRIVYIWLLLGVQEEAFKTVAVLGYNHPESKWYTESLKLVEKYSSYKVEDKIERIPLKEYNPVAK